MRVVLTILFLSIFLQVSAQLKPGFNVNEATSTIAMCNSFNFIKQFGTNKNIIPAHFNLHYSSDILSMDNKFEVYKNDTIAIINYRGSTDKMISWVENCYSAMIPAKGTIVIDKKEHDYAFASAENAAVHAGYALTVVLLSEEIIAQIKSLNAKEIYNIIITGHSQGGALASLTRAYLENVPKGKLSKQNRYKTYAYAQPMSGNKEFAEEYNTRFSELETSYSIINKEDPVPYMPFNYEEDKLITKQKISGWLFGNKAFEPKKLGQDAFIRLFERGLTSYVKGSNTLINKILGLKFGKIEMPAFVADINYYPTGKRKELPAFTYPKIEVNIAEVAENERQHLEQDSNGKWYKKEAKFFQHKPYNYYVAVLKKWNTTAYNHLEITYLLSDL
ncbi:lipase family protein [Lacinutrix sp. C3R15]|uniref:lipase family protein n=1 Tax=Flavobacteriaceae TaxID=49546 RepID=UPI001C094506|nr:MULTISPECIES: lipase family protein [Flavobacteriaceae]MBU2938362.1 lipase family protein [Lacinutrix sp. C3R15]MDO6621677.1 lipase family protein [Oceanihabitans sp. 1_MG-2023]